MNNIIARNPKPDFPNNVVDTGIEFKISEP